MRDEELDKILQALAGECCSARGLELVELIYHFERGSLLRVLVDRPNGGITLDELAGVNSALVRLFEEKNLLAEGYHLEVNSPGLDRPLKTARDFCRNTGKRIKVFLSLPINGKIELDGIVRESADEAVTLETAAEQVRIPLSLINKAKLLIF
jgi:ribosome maturation factor RimP